EELQSSRGEIVVLDPFAGVGTAVIAGEEAGANSYGLEAHPFITRVANSKLLWHTDVTKFLSFSQNILTNARSLKSQVTLYPELIKNCFPENVLRDLHNLKSAWKDKANGTPSSELAWLAITSILRVCSPVGTAPWQYVLPKKSKSKIIPPYEAFTIQVEKMAFDMNYFRDRGVKPKGKVFCSDARDCDDIKDCSVDLVITSPPYTNNYDYADATRLEMSFWGEVKKWANLHNKVRHLLIRSCTQHVSIEKLKLEPTIETLKETPIVYEVKETCAKLAEERKKHGGKKDYHLMVAAYFSDMNRVWKALRRVCKDGAIVCFVVGDSAPYGIYVPVDKWLGELAVNAGFKSFHFEKLRDRNIKWRNRKHRVLLHEGFLRIEG
ncbi:MAG: hypothetical protein PHW74_13635, partial [Desulfobacca sp.]|nr:hypothetical protein [Desulfobacca sp.]